VSAMRHSNPAAVTIIFSGFPEMKEAAAAILLQADEILVKPMAPMLLIQTIRERLKRGTPTRPRPAENVATILEQSTQSTIEDWLLLVELEPHLIDIPIEYRGTLRSPTAAFPRPGLSPSEPLTVGYARYRLSIRDFPRAFTPQTRLQCSYDGRGVAHAAGQHIPNPPKQPLQGGLQPLTRWCHGNS
jgi:hypothetical protein